MPIQEERQERHVDRTLYEEGSIPMQEEGTHVDALCPTIPNRFYHFAPLSFHRCLAHPPSAHRKHENEAASELDGRFSLSTLQINLIVVPAK
jgi:hypothetical protein